MVCRGISGTGYGIAAVNSGRFLCHSGTDLDRVEESGSTDQLCHCLSGYLPQYAAGHEGGDEQLLEMADVFGMSAWSRLWYVYRPALLPYLLAGSRIACGMAWKSGVAAEVIGVPELSIGEKLYMAKIYLSTAELFAWTFVVIVVSRLLERAFLWLLGQLSAKRMGDRRERTANRTKRLERDGCSRPEAMGGFSL